MKKIFFILILATLLSVATSSFAEDYTDEISKYNLSNFKFPDETPAEENTTATLPTDTEEIKEGETIQAESNNETSQIVLSDEVSLINSMTDDEQKAKQWAKYNATEYYIIINKKDCSATIYGKNGDEINKFEVGIGSEIGDDFNDTKGMLGKPKNTTPAGEYTLITNIYNKSAYGDVTLSLGAKANKAKNVKKVVALHKVPKFREKDRLAKFHDGNLSNNRMSHGCINFMEDDFNELTKYIRGGLKIYVLPEESDNQLILTKNDKDEFELAQTKYKKS